MLKQIFSSVITSIVFIAIVLAMIIYSTFSWGLVLYKFWYWFLMPVFNTKLLDIMNPIPDITFYQAVGLSMFISLFHTHNAVAIKKKYRDEKSNIVLAIVFPWIALFIGWILYSLLLTNCLSIHSF